MHFIAQKAYYICGLACRGESSDLLVGILGRKGLGCLERESIPLFTLHHLVSHRHFTDTFSLAAEERSFAYFRTLAQLLKLPYLTLLPLSVYVVACPPMTSEQWLDRISARSLIKSLYYLKWPRLPSIATHGN